MERVSFGRADLGGHVERRADICRGEIVRLHDLGKAEIAELDGIVLGEENYDGSRQLHALD